MREMAYLDENNICEFIVGFDEVKENYINTSYNTIILQGINNYSLIGKKYDNGAWIEVKDKSTESYDTEVLMQSLTDIELQNISAQQEREMLAQQMTDLELLLLEGR